MSIRSVWADRTTAACLLGSLLLTSPLSAQLVTAKRQTIAGLDPDDGFGRSAVCIGDVDGDQIDDWAVGAYGDDDGGPNRGSVYVLFLGTGGCIREHRKISSTQGGLPPSALQDFDNFGNGVAALGDLDDDSVPDIAVGEPNDDDGGNGRGAVWILFLQSDGTVKSAQKISSTAGSFPGPLMDIDQFGVSVAGLGDLDGDGVEDLAVGADGDGLDTGAVWILFLQTDGTVGEHQKIAAGEGGFAGLLSPGDEMGYSVAAIGDVDEDGVPDLAAGAPFTDDGGPDRGAVWLLLLHPSGLVKAGHQISSTTGGFGGSLSDGDRFGESVARTGDLNNDGQLDLAVGTSFDGIECPGNGAVWELYLDPACSFTACGVVGETELGCMTPGIALASEGFAQAVAGVGDLNGDKRLDLVVSSVQHSGGRGALWTLDRGASSDVASRNGSGCNPVSFTSTSFPVVGQSWKVLVALTPPQVASAVFFGAGGPTSGLKLGGTVQGEILCWPPYPAMDVSFGVHCLPLPCDPWLVGQRLCFQAATFATGDIRLTNALDATIGTY